MVKGILTMYDGYTPAWTPIGTAPIVVPVGPTAGTVTKGAATTPWGRGRRRGSRRGRKRGRRCKTILVFKDDRHCHRVLP